MKNERELLERCLRSLREQTVPVQIVVVDSGSTDGSLDVAKAHADELLRIAPEAFSFGHALNVGAAAADGDVHFALSSHCRAERRDWVALSLAHYEHPRVAATHGTRIQPDRRPLNDVVLQDAELGRRFPYWGLSNHASSWRADVWREQSFDENLPACEDKAWAWRVMEAGWLVAVDPALDVSKDHRQVAGTRALYARSVKEAEALARVRPLPPRSAASAVRSWWTDIPRDEVYPPLFHRLNYFRAAEIAGRWVGERRARR